MIIVLVIVLVLFGGSQIPKLARNLGKAQKEFKDGIEEAKSASSVTDARARPSQHRRSGTTSAVDRARVGGGSLDAYVDMTVDAHGVWDYLAGVLVCHEAGCPVVDAHGRELAVLDHDRSTIGSLGVAPSTRRGRGGTVAFMDFGGPEMIIVLVIVLVLFGGSQIPKLARNLGKAQKEFKDGIEEAKSASSVSPTPCPAESAPPIGDDVNR